MNRPRTSRPPLLHPLALRLALLLTFGLGACRMPAQPPPPPALETPAFGAAGAPVEVLAFVDFACPYSRQEGQVLRDLVAQFPTQVRVRVLYLPMDLYPESVVVARGAVAAAEQNAFPAFWQKWLRPDAAPSRDALIAWAVEAGLDARKFVATLDGPAAQARVARDVAIAHALGITGTPSFLVNGALLQGQQSLATLVTAVRHEMAETAILQSAGAQPQKLVHARVAQNAERLQIDYERYIERAQSAPPQPVPMASGMARTSGVATAQVKPAALDPAFGGQRALLLPAGATTTDVAVWRVLVRADDPQLGEPDAPVTLVLFLDLFAQETAAILPWLVQLPTTQPNVRLVIKHLPRPIHPLAQMAAEALEAAREQEQFTPFLRQLLAAPQPLTQARVLRASAQLGLDASRFNTALAAHSGKQRIDADVEQAAELGVNGFAALYANGVQVPELTQTAVQAAVAAQTEKAAALQKTGIARAALYDALTGKGKLLDALGPEVHAFDLSHAAVQGLPGAPVQIVVFGDLQCPFTARLWPHLRQLDEEMPGRLKLAWLDSPQTTVHPLAEQLAEAGQEARRQGKFWPFVAALARRVDLLDDRSLGQAAREAGLKDRPLQSALAQHQWTQAVQAERAQGEQAGVRGTPTLFLDGHLFQPANGISADTLRPAIRRLLGTH